MRFKINLIADNVKLPNNNQHLVNSYIHRAIGVNNAYHDKNSNYSVSSMQGGFLNLEEKNILITDSSCIVVSSFDEEFSSKLLVGVINNPIFYDGIKIKSIEPIQEVFYNGKNHFRTISPFLIKENNVDIEKGNFTSLKEMENWLNKKVLSKLEIVNVKSNLGLDFTNFNLTIDWCHSVRRFMKPGCRAFNVNNCGFTLTSNKKVAELLYNIGIGQSTGAGFGALCKAETFFLYRNEKMSKIDATLSENSHFLTLKQL